MAEVKTGIYQIRCKRNGKRYIGKSLDIKRRWKEHVRALNDEEYSECKPDFQEDWNKYKENGFEFRILKLCKRYSLARLEAKYIQKRGDYNNLKPQLRGLNFQEWVDIVEIGVVMLFVIYVGCKVYHYFI
jgi:group I intron endonuclease